MLDSNDPWAGKSPAASLPIATAVVGLAILTGLCPSSAASSVLVRRSTPRLSSATHVASTQVPAVQATPSGPARVVVTISLEGVRIPAVNVTLTDVDGNVTIAKTTSDGIGQVMFPDVPPGHYVVKAQRDGFADSESARFTVSSGETEQVLVEMRLTFVRESVDVVVPANSPTESMQPVAVSDLLSGAKMDIQPLAGDDFQSLLTVLPSTIRGPEGRLRVKGGAPTTGALVPVYPP